MTTAVQIVLILSAAFVGTVWACAWAERKNK